MGVSGAGKSTVGSALARQLGWAFHEGDELHPPENVARMRAGIALTDADREPWLRALETLVERLARSDRSAVIACSALKEKYRERLRAAVPSDEGSVRFVHLRVSAEEARRRIAARSGHFMPADLVASQLETLEEPVDAIVVDADVPVADIVARIRASLEPTGPRSRT